MNNSIDPVVAFSIGDPNGIGPEIILKALDRKDILKMSTPVIFCTHKLWGYLYNYYGAKTPYLRINSPKEIKKNKVNVINIDAPDVLVQFGASNSDAGEFSFASLAAATDAVSKGYCDVLVTAPINKANIQSQSFNFPGHTEYLEQAWGGKALMFMVHQDLKVGLVTQHIPIEKVAQNITEEHILSKTKLMLESLQKDYSRVKPTIAILGLNPHAGDNGLLGKEEQKIIIPTIKKLLDKGNYVYGPFPADSFFVYDKLKKFDAVLAMYHDQGLTSFKTLAGIEGVNFTAGLKHVRTSPDHGVGYDIAGEKIANPTSMVEAIYTACVIFNRRKMNEELEQNALKPSENTKNR